LQANSLRRTAAPERTRNDLKLTVAGFIEAHIQEKE
jgi:hypothetical protein